MDADLENAYNLIVDAVCAEDVFGNVNDPTGAHSPQQVLEQKFRALSETTNPDNYRLSPDDGELAWEARERLTKFYERAIARLEIGSYGSRQKTTHALGPGAPRFTTKKREYAIGQAIAEGSISTVFLGECLIKDEFAGMVAIKVANEPADNDLIWREKRTLEFLHTQNGRQRKHLPVLLDHFTTEEGQAGLVFRSLSDYRDLDSLRQLRRYENGIDRKFVVRMLLRSLSAAGYAHANGVIHGNIEPAHCFFHQNHNLVLIDWCWSVHSPRKTGETFRIFTEQFSAPEVREKKTPLPSADLYSIGKCMIYALGGDVETNEMPGSVEEEIQRFISFLTLQSPLGRAQDAWEAYGILSRLRVELWGVEPYRPFELE